MKKYDTIMEDAYTNSKEEQFSKKKLWLDSPWKSKKFNVKFRLNLSKKKILELFCG